MSVHASPGLLAAVAASVPSRITKRLDAEPGVAKQWTWATEDERTTVVTSGGEKVVLTAKDGVVTSPADVACSCLLSPRCFHVLAVVGALDIASDAEPSTVESADSAGSATPEAPARTVVPAAARQLATWARKVVSDVIATGARGVGAVLEGELLRVVHRARLEGMFRLAASGLRVVRHVRDARSDAPDFVLTELVDDLRDVLVTARALEGAEVEPETIGVARRAYRPVGHMRLLGVCCEPVLARGGYAGVTTYLCDERGTIWSISDVMPGGPERAAGAYDAAIAMGDTTITHRALGRGGLFVQNATGSPDLRLGAGKDVDAVRAATTTPSFETDAMRARFAVPLADQIAGAYAALAIPEASRPRSSNLVFSTGHVIGQDPGGLWVETTAGPVRLAPESQHPTLAYLETLRVLARAGGLSLAFVARVVPGAPRTLTPLAFGAGPPIEGAPKLRLPPEWAGKANAGYDLLTFGMIEGSATPAPRLAPSTMAAVDPLDALRRRIERFALYGARSLPPEALSVVDRERMALSAVMMGGASDVLGALAVAARSPSRAQLADVWLAASSYARAASLSYQASSWDAG